MQRTVVERASLTELTTRSSSLTSAVSGSWKCACARILCVLGSKGVVAVFHLVSVFLSARNPLRGCFHSTVPPFISNVLTVRQALVFLPPRVAHGWVARICHPWERPPSRNRLSTMKALAGVSRAPTTHTLQGSY